MNVSKLANCAASLCVGIVMAGAASAGTITTQTENFSFVPDGNQTLTFNQFNGSLGTLTNVTVTVSLTKSGGTYSVDNDSASSGSITLTQKVVGSLSSDDVALYSTRPIGSSTKLTSQSTTTTSLSATTGDSTTDFNATGLGDYFSWAPSSATVSDSGNISSAMYYDGRKGYIGTSTFDVLIDGIQSQSTSGMSGLQGAYTASTASGYVTIVYEYTPVPEPTAAMLLVLGGAGVLLRRRRS